MTPPRPLLFAGLLAAVASLTAVRTAHAASATASASLSELSFTLIDLDPTDGIAPSLTYIYPSTVDGSAGFGTVDAYTRPGNGTDIHDYRDFAIPIVGQSFVAPGSAEATAGGAQALATTTLNALSAQAHASLTGSPLSTTDFSIASAFVCPKEACYSAQEFRLSAHTQLLIQGQYALSGAVEATGKAGDFVQVAIDLGVSFAASGARTSQTVALSKFLTLDGTAGSAHSDAQSGSFAWRITNDGTGLGRGTIFPAVVSAYAVAVTASPVPEAHALGLALAGAGVAGVSGARRRRLAKATPTSPSPIKAQVPGSGTA